MRSARPSMNAVLTEPAGWSTTYGDWSVSVGFIGVLFPYYFLCCTLFWDGFITVFFLSGFTVLFLASLFTVFILFPSFWALVWPYAFYVVAYLFGRQVFKGLVCFTVCFQSLGGPLLSNVINVMRVPFLQDGQRRCFVSCLSSVCTLPNCACNTGMISFLRQLLNNP